MTDLQKNNLSETKLKRCYEVLPNIIEIINLIATKEENKEKGKIIFEYKNYDMLLIIVNAIQDTIRFLESKNIIIEAVQYPHIRQDNSFLTIFGTEENGVITKYAVML
jgi:hypothetical protein